MSTKVIGANTKANLILFYFVVVNFEQTLVLFNENMGVAFGPRYTLIRLQALRAPAGIRYYR